MKKNETVFLLTDGCMWELNKQAGSEHPHAIEVVDLATGAVRYIRSGSKISLVDGEISDIRTQKAYNKATATVSNNEQTLPQQGTSQKDSGKNKQ